MDVKKKNFMDNFRLKTKLAKKPRKKKPLAKQGRNLAHRRSISVPDLRLGQGEALSRDNVLARNDSDAIFFGTSSGISDSDSVKSGSIADGLLFADKPNLPLPDTGRRVALTPAVAALHRISAPVESLTLYEETDGADFFNFETCPTPRIVYTNTISPSPRSVASGGEDTLTAERVSGEESQLERVLSGSIAAALARASSPGEQLSTQKEKKTITFEKRTPPAVRANAPADRTSLIIDTSTPLESADGVSLDSACDTPSDERVNMPWMDLEDAEQEPCTPMSMREFFTEENLLEENQFEEALENIAEGSSEPCDYFDENVQYPLETSTTTVGGGEVQVPMPFQRYLLDVNLKRGKNLVIRNKRSGTSDPYVKFKLEGKQLYKSKVVYKNLNPRWNESFSYPLRDREHIIEVRLYDKNRTTDEFMGSSTIALKDLDLYKTYELELHLDDPKSKEADMGTILVDVCLMFRDATIKRSPRWPQRKNKQNLATAPQRTAEATKNQPKNRMWTGALDITLVEGLDLPQHGHGDIYVRFRLGNQKYKSKNLCIQANPQWRERFDFNQFEDSQEPLQVELYSKRGRKGVESWGMFEVDLSRLTLNQTQHYTHMLDPGKGRLVFLASLRPCWGVSVSDVETALLDNQDERDRALQKFSLKYSHKNMREVGLLQVKVIKANDLPSTDINGKSNSFCVVELGNSKLQTHTVYKTVNPDWNKAFTFPIKDIHDVIELTVLDDNGDKAPNVLGKVAIPLLTVQNGQQISPCLKKEDLGSASKGTITLELEVIYNKVRAGIKTFQPKEAKLMEEDMKFSKKVLARNIFRVRKISTAVLYTLQYIKSCFQWESTQRSLIAFLIFLVTVWHWELFMLPLFLMLLIGWYYFQLSAGKGSSSQDLVNMSMGDEEEEDEKECGKKGLMDKIHMVQEVVLAVQNALEEIANIGEQMKNIVNWSVPFLSCLACLVLFVTTALLYFIPLRYIVLIWGVNKFTKKLRNPYAIDNNEILDFLKRVPSDVEKVHYSALRAPTSQPRKKK